jgi:hypothetical protein
MNESPTQVNSRYVISFGAMTESEARGWPELMQILERNVKPERAKSKDPNTRKNWWLFERSRIEFFESIRHLNQVIALSRVGEHTAFTFVKSNCVFADSIVVFRSNSYGLFAVLQSRLHEVWARFFASTAMDLLRYTSSICFETFPLPSSLLELEIIGRSYCELRSRWMSSSEIGLTKTYNRFHSPGERDPGILGLRRLHNEMDVTVLRAYGWDELADQDSQPDFCQFLLDYEEDEEDSAFDTTSARQKKKPWRYRWPDDFRDEVLARLLELNEKRHKEELLLVKGNPTEAKPAKEPSKKPAKATPLLDGLDQVELDPDERLILLIVDSFKLITRTAVDEAFIAMKYPKLRKSRLGLGDPPKSVPPTDAGRDAFIGGLVDRGFLIKHPSDHQQVWKLGAYAPSLVATKAERQALDETKAIFQKSIDANDDLASCKEGVTDAKPGFVSIA